MKIYIIFLTKLFLSSLLYVFMIVLSLVFILNILSEIEFFKQYEVSSYYPIYLSILNSPTILFEIFPFIFLISTQVFFIKLFNNNEIQIFKYSGLKNTKIVIIIGIISFIIGILIITFYYTISSNFKNFYLELKTKYVSDSNHLTVITKNGLWMKDIINNNLKIINASKLNENFLQDVIITEFDKDFNSIRTIKSKKINISNKDWVLFESVVYDNKKEQAFETLIITSNFDYKKIQNLLSNLSSLSIIKLFVLKKNYEILNYSSTDVSIQLNKLFSLPIYFTLMTIFSSIIMLNTKKFRSSSLKITVGLFLSVIIYYLNNFFYVMGNLEKISILTTIWVPLIAFAFINMLIMISLNEK